MKTESKQQRSRGSTRDLEVQRQDAGQALDARTRAALEPRFGHDFGDVRVFADGQADQLAQRYDARALTVGQDVYFASGQYDPASVSGMGLLAHELTHTIQQRGAKMPDALEVSRRDGSSEREAQTASSQVLAGHSAQVSGAASISVARQEDDAPDLSDLNDPLNELSPLKDTPFRFNPFPKSAPDPFDNPRGDSQKDWDKGQAERRGDKYPNPLIDPAPKDPKDPHDDPLYWKDWNKPTGPTAPPYMPTNPLTIDPTLPPWIRPDLPWLKPAPPEPPKGDFPLPDQDERYT